MLISSLANNAKMSRNGCVALFVMMPHSLQNERCGVSSVSLCTPPPVSHRSIIVATTAAVYTPALSIDSICLYLPTCVCVCVCV